MVTKQTVTRLIKNIKEVDVKEENYRTILIFGNEQPGSRLYSYMVDVTDMTQKEVLEEIEFYFENKQEN